MNSDTKYSKLVYYSQLQDIDDFPNAKNQALHVKNLLSRLGFYEVWLNQGVHDVKLFLNIFKVKDNYLQCWNDELQTSSRALFYRQIADLEYKKYLSCVEIPKFRTALTRLKSHLINLKLKLVTGIKLLVSLQTRENVNTVTNQKMSTILYFNVHYLLNFAKYF